MGLRGRFILVPEGLELAIGVIQLELGRVKVHAPILGRVGFGFAFYLFHKRNDFWDVFRDPGDHGGPLDLQGKEDSRKEKKEKERTEKRGEREKGPDIEKGEILQKLFFITEGQVLPVNCPLLGAIDNLVINICHPQNVGMTQVEVGEDPPDDVLGDIGSERVAK